MPQCDPVRTFRWTSERVRSEREEDVRRLLWLPCRARAARRSRPEGRETMTRIVVAQGRTVLSTLHVGFPRRQALARAHASISLIIAINFECLDSLLEQPTFSSMLVAPAYAIQQS